MAIIREGSIEMADELDKDGQMEIEIDNGDFQYAWINKEEAIRMIEHLNIVFELTPS